MEIYIILFWYEILIALFLEKRLRKNDQIIVYSSGKVKIYVKQFTLLLLLVLPLWLVMGMRYGIGTDFHEYRRIFEYIASEKDVFHGYENIELGFKIFDYLIALFTDNAQWMFLLSSFIIIAGYLKGFYDNRNSLVICIAAFMGLGYYFYAMNIFRQYMAMAVVFSGITYLEHGQIKKFLCFILAACLFHTSVLIWLPILVLIKVLPGRNYYYVTLFIGFLLFYNQTAIIRFLSRFTKYQSFFEKNSHFVQSRVSYTNILISAIILFVAFLFRKQMLNVNRINDLRIKCVWFMFITYICMNFLGDSIIRVVLHFSIYCLLILADAFMCIGKKGRAFFQICFVVVMFLSIFIILYYDSNITHQFVPYVSGTLQSIDQ